MIDEDTRFGGVASWDEIQMGQSAIALGEETDDVFHARAMIVLPAEVGWPGILRGEVQQVGDDRLILRSGRRDLEVEIVAATRVQVRGGGEAGGEVGGGHQRIAWPPRVGVGITIEAL